MRRTTLSASTLACTSCTRTPHAPSIAASAETTAVAVSRPSGGRGVPSAPASRAPRKRLRDAPDQHRDAGGDELRQRMQQRPIVLRRLGESQSGVDDHVGPVHPGGDRGVDSGEQFVANLGHHVAVVRHVVRAGRRGRSASASSPTEPRRSASNGAIAGSARPPEHVVDDAGSVLQCRRRDGRVHGVDADGDTLGGKLFHNRKHPGGLDGGVDAHRAGPGGLAADVDDRAPWRDQPKPCSTARTGSR